MRLGLGEGRSRFLRGSRAVGDWKEPVETPSAAACGGCSKKAMDAFHPAPTANGPMTARHCCGPRARGSAGRGPWR